MDDEKKRAIFFELLIAFGQGAGKEASVPRATCEAIEERYMKHLDHAFTKVSSASEVWPTPEHGGRVLKCVRNTGAAAAAKAGAGSPINPQDFKDAAYKCETDTHDESHCSWCPYP